MIERHIIINLITSTEFNQRLQDLWNPTLFESGTAKRISSWCAEYFQKYNKAPGKALEPIFYEKAKRLPKDIAEEIEEEILPSLSEQYESEQDFNLEYAVDQALLYFTDRRLLIHASEIKALVETNQSIEAEAKASTYISLKKNVHSWIDLSDGDNVKLKIEQAFSSAGECLIEFPKALGDFWNDQLTRGAFVAFLAPEKRGKTFLLMELAIRACKQRRKVAFFQAGDMSEEEQLKRICIYLTKKSNKEKYAGVMFEPVADCIWNQTNKCNQKERECDFGIFPGKPEHYLKKEIPFDEIKQAFEDNPDYRPCTNCALLNEKRLGTVWLSKVDVGNPLTVEEAQKAIDTFFVKYKRAFKLSTHPAGTLTVKQSEAIMDIWEKEDGFVPDVILYDYPDIMEDNTKEFRHKQNEIWKSLRGVSQKKKALVIVVTQADAESYKKNSLGLSNFSEDKRKFGHVTAMYGLNQDPGGREKELGVMRINEIVVREGAFNTNHQVHVLQNLKRGRPILTSYW